VSSKERSIETERERERERLRNRDTLRDIGEKPRKTCPMLPLC